ncbi:hypothetical protein ONZ51_g7088 [Trametes cubensis]|uniref:HAT C-terminal dimerisation domain-containing protein n=1 Tax=Trametes cubensis TaxID=1111947 RepID=A0AAD7TQT8_9APHY|nr:hypothetical protein ONZ51_g7088 [Trametes cubensis]
MQNYRGRVSFTTDGWTSPNHRAYIALGVHFEKDGVPMSMLLDFVELAVSHTGVNLAAAFVQVLKDFGVEEKILGVTCDNALNNDTMVNALEVEVPSFRGQNARTRCFDHVVNLVAKALTRQFDHKKGDSRRSDDDLEVDLESEELAARFELYKELGGEGDDDEEGLLDELSSMSEADRVAYLESVQPVRMVLVKLRKVAFKIVNSTTLLLPSWRKTLADLQLPDKLIPRDVRTRWNSTFDMLDMAVKYRKAVDVFCADKENKLRQYELSETEWKIAEQLQHALRIFKDATLFFSRDTPNLATVIPAMEHMSNMLDGCIRDEVKYEEPIRIALSLAKRTLTKYYNLTDAADTYRIAMVLHPRYKTAYFKQLNWTRAYIESTRKLVRAEYDTIYARMPPPLADESDGEAEHPDGCEKNVDSSGAESVSENIFDNMPDLFSGNSRRTLSNDELDLYLKAEPEAVSNPIQWWHTRRRLFPRLSRMALDYLTIPAPDPATSVDVERTFSRGRLLLPHVRNRLSAQTTRALLCLGAWSVRGFIKKADLIDVAKLPDVKAPESDVEMEDGWDVITLIRSDSRASE